MEPTSQHTAAIQEPHTANKPLGEVAMPGLICGSVGAILTIILSLAGRYNGLALSLKEFYMAEPFYMTEASSLHFGWDWLFVLLLTFGVSFAVLDTDKKWRRLMIILLASVVVIFSSPVLMLWDVFWSPVIVFVGLIWSWICAFIYSCQHTMPCELLLPSQKVEQMHIEPLATSERKLDLVEHEKENVAEEKYQPKDTSCPD